MKLDKPAGFIGREALLARRAQAPAKRLVSLVFDSADAWAWGGEALFLDGEPAGEITSAGWSPKLGACVALGYLRGAAATERHAAPGSRSTSGASASPPRPGTKPAGCSARRDVSEPAPFSLRSIAVPAFGPALLFASAKARSCPWSPSPPATSAPRCRGRADGHADRPRSLFFNLPASLITMRFGERWAMVGAGVWRALGDGCSASSSPQPWALSRRRCSWSAWPPAVFSLARQKYLTEAVPVILRARALSTLGGVTGSGSSSARSSAPR